MILEGRLVEDGRRVRVETSGERISSVREVAGAPDVWIAPGLLDLQVNGYAGLDLNTPDVTPETVTGLTRSLWALGVTGFCPTVITGPRDRMLRSLEAVAGACDHDTLTARTVLGVHVEGPHISPEDGPRGAHPIEYVRPPDLEEYPAWQGASGGRVRIVTLSPEYLEAPEYVCAIVRDGVVAAIGHTAATGEQIRAAVEAGARLSTHLGNGAHALLPRHPNYIWDQLAEDRLFASFIFDGHHLPPPVMKAMLRAKGLERSILVSDAVAVAGLPPGVYETPVGGRVELLPDGRLNLYGTSLLAGSTGSLLDGVTNAARHTDASLAEAFRLASFNPARLLGLEDRGTIREGARADLVALSQDPATGRHSAVVTLLGGEVVYSDGSH